MDNMGLVEYLKMWTIYKGSLLPTRVKSNKICIYKTQELSLSKASMFDYRFRNAKRRLSQANERFAELCRYQQGCLCVLEATMFLCSVSSGSSFQPLSRLFCL